MNIEKVLEYLEEGWTSHEILNLEKKLKKLLERIIKYPESCPPTNFKKNLHKGLVDKNNYIVFRVNNKKKIIEIINFRGTKQKPIY